MAQSASLSAAIAGRYAQAVFDLAREEGGLDALAQQTEALRATLDASPELRGAFGSAAIGREQQAGVAKAIAGKLGLGPVLSNTLALMAENRRLFALPQLLAQLGALLAEARGETTATVTTAAPLSAAQAERLTRILSQKSGKSVQLDARVDPALIGGMVVKLGSRMIDSSIRSKLDSLQTTMREAR